MSLEIKSTGTKIASIAGKVLPPFAGVLAFASDPLKQGLLTNPDQAIKWMVATLSNWKFPDLLQFTKQIKTDPSYSFIPSALASAIAIGIAQHIAREWLGIPLPTSINATANTLKKTAASAVAGGLTGALIWLPGKAAAPPEEIVAYGYQPVPTPEIGELYKPPTEPEALREVVERMEPYPEAILPIEERIEISPYLTPGYGFYPGGYGY